MKPPFLRRAHWISPSNREIDPAAIAAAFYSDDRIDLSEYANVFWYLRKTFDLSNPPKKAIAHVSADGRYRFYVNGTYVGRGPARCAPAFQTFDTRDITPFLRAGRNVVAILLHSYGRDMSWYQLPPRLHLAACGCAGVFFQGDITLQDGASLDIDSDGSWRCQKAEAWQQDTVPGLVGFMEVLDARAAPADWAEPNFDDSAWPAGRDLSPFNPFPYIEPRAIPYLSEKERLPTAVAGTGDVDPAAEAANPFEQVDKESIAAAPSGRIEGVDGLLEGKPVMIASGAARDAAVVLDFGDTMTGYPRLDLTAPAGTIIDIAYSERLCEGKPELTVPGPIISPTVHRYVAREGRQTWEKFEWVGFRYLQLTVRNPLGPVTLHKVAVNDTTYPVEERGAFECSDPLLSQIWQAGAKTVRRCMHDGYEDCPSREQRQWMGDVFVESLTNYAAFGDTRLVAQALRQLSQSQRPDGMTAMAAPGDLAVKSVVAIPDWGLYWVLTLGEYVKYTGDLSVAEDVIAPVIRLLDWFHRFTDEHGLLNNLPDWNLIDWAKLDRNGENAANNALYCRTLRVTEELADRLRMPLLAERCAKRADRIRDGVNARHWDEERGVYVDSCVNGKQGRRVSQQSNVTCIAYGIAPRERWDRIFEAILDESRLVITRTGMRAPDIDEPPFDEERNVVMAQPFFMHHVHRALVAAGRYDDFLRNIRRRWGAMIKAGATTIWEVWHPLVSQCHGWSTTPTFDLSTEVLGVAPLEPGFARLRIAPPPVDLESAKGIFPTVKGDVSVVWRREAGAFHLSVNLPAAVTAEVTLPPCDGGWTTVRAGEAADVLADEAARSRAGIAGIATAGESITLTVGGPRELHLEARK